MYLHVFVEDILVHTFQDVNSHFGPINMTCSYAYHISSLKFSFNDKQQDHGCTRTGTRDGYKLLLSGMENIFRIMPITY